MSGSPDRPMPSRTRSPVAVGITGDVDEMGEACATAGIRAAGVDVDPNRHDGAA